jgi:Flp pilus assembly protein TadG
MRNLLSHAADLRRNAAGNVLVEAALFLPLALMLFGGVVDFSMAVTQKLRAQQAVARSLEMVSNVPMSSLNETMLVTEAANAAGIAQSKVTARVWLECDGVAQANLFDTCSTSTGLARYASITINDTYNLQLYSRLAKFGAGEESLNYQVQGSLRIQ